MKLLNTLALTAILLTSCQPVMAQLTEYDIKYCGVVKKLAATAMTAAQYQEDYLRMVTGLEGQKMVLGLFNEAYSIAETELYVTEEHIDRKVREFSNAKARECIEERSNG